MAYMNERGFELTGLAPVVRVEILRIMEHDSVMIRTCGSP